MIDADKIYINPKNGINKHSDIKSNLILGESDINDPLISILIPTFSRPEQLKAAIKSALSQINFGNYEVVVVDNNYESIYIEKTNDVVNSFNDKRLKLYRNAKNIGMYGNWNRCLELAKGKWVSILNDDDLLQDNFLSQIVIYLHEDLSIVAAKRTIVDLRSTKSESNRKKYFKFLQIFQNLNNSKVIKIEKKDLFFKNVFGNSSGVVFDKKKAILLGGFNENYYPSADYDLWIRMSKIGECIIINKFLSSYSIDTNESLNPKTLCKFIKVDRYLRFKYFLNNNKKYDKFISRMADTISYAQLLRRFNVKFAAPHQTTFYFIVYKLSMIMGYSLSYSILNFLSIKTFKNK